MFAAGKTKGVVATAANYIEDVFSTYLYTGTGATQTITNGIDLSTKGGLVWTKARYYGITHRLVDTARGATYEISSDTTDAQSVNSTGLTSFGSTGYTIGSAGGYNNSGGTYVGWTFRKQPKFFDVVTYTGNGSTYQTIAHSLASTPGCIIIKSTSGTGNWGVYHQSIPTGYLTLNTTNANTAGLGFFQNVTSTSFETAINTNGVTYVAYLFAHNAGGFGLTGTDNVISCGSYTGNGSTTGPIVNLGYEPQWLMVKRASGASAWYVIDNMRGMALTGNGNSLYPNTSGAENSYWAANFININSTGFQVVNTDTEINASGNTYIYIAIRRGPMKVPTTGTSVYENTAYTGNGTANRQIGSSVLTDLLLLENRDATATSWSTYGQMFFDRLRGDDVSLATANGNSEVGGWNTYIDFDMNAGWDTGTTVSQDYLNKTSSTYVSNIFKRAPNFLDVVCYTGTGSATTFSHNLTVVPEMMIVKSRSGNVNWAIYTASTGATKWMYFGTAGASTLSSIWNDTAPTSSIFTIGSASPVNDPGATYVNYLFATCAGVSKVFSFTGNGTTQTINCGFTGGARFVLLKATSTTGGWFVYDTARGMTILTDPYLQLNSTAAESATLGSVTTVSTGFAVNESILTGVNTNGVSYIGLAIA
jgi:hypothetical protein